MLLKNKFFTPFLKKIGKPKKIGLPSLLIIACWGSSRLAPTHQSLTKTPLTCWNKSLYFPHVKSFLPYLIWNIARNIYFAYFFVQIQKYIFQNTIGWPPAPAISVVGFGWREQTRYSVSLTVNCRLACSSDGFSVYKKPLDVSVIISISANLLNLLHNLFNKYIYI